MPLAFSLFGPAEMLGDALARGAGLDPVTGAGAALAFFVHEFIKVSILILAISWVMGLVRHSLPLARMRTWLTTPTGRALGYPAAAGFGAVTPFCSCSSVPLFIGFVEAGIPLGVTFAFLITSPLVNEIVVALFIASFGWQVALIYAASGIVLGVLGGAVMQAVRVDRWLTPFARDLRGVEAEAGCCEGEGEGGCDPASESGGLAPRPTGEDACCGEAGTACCARRPAPGRLAFATAEAWRIYRQVVLYLGIALLVGAAIHGFLPEGFFVAFFQGGGWWHVPAAVGMGFPLYASANATVPVLETLVAKGVPLGTAMAFIMSAVGVSLPELIILKRVMTVRLLALFTLVVCLGVMLVGTLFNFLPAFR